MADGEARNTDETVTWEVARAVGSACGKFEADWRAGLMPEVETFLANYPDEVHWPLRRELTLLLRSLNGEDRRATPTALAEGTELGGYVVLEKIGEGGMGAVYKAVHRRLGRVVALKTLSPSVRDTAEAMRRFDREVRLIARLSHPNIVAAHDAREFEGIPYLVMEYVEGSDLSRLVREKGPLPADLVVDLARQTAKGLAHAHGEGILHRDIKPSNLLLDTSGTVKILDLGLARFLEADPIGLDESTASELTLPGALLGSVDFMSPEQAADTRRADARSDLYSLGCTLYFLLTGRPPYALADARPLERVLAHVNNSIPSPRADRPAVSEALDLIVRKLMAKSPCDRFATAAELLLALDGTPEAAVVARPIEIPIRRPLSRWLFLGSAVAAAVLIVGLGWRGLPTPTTKGLHGDTSPVAPSPHPSVPIADPSRRLAEAVFRIGGQILILGDQYPTQTTAALPERPFALEWIDLERSEQGSPREKSHIGDDDIAFFEELVGVEKLHLGGTQVTDAGLDHLKNLSALTGIFLPSTAITDAATPKLARLPMLRQIVLLKTEVGDNALPPILVLKDLRFLNLTRTRVTDRGLETLAKLRTLESLDVAEDAVTDTGLISVGRMSRLTSLNIAKTGVTDAGLVHLRGLRLKQIHLTGSRVTAPGVRRFKEEHPDCKVEH